MFEDGSDDLMLEMCPVNARSPQVVRAVIKKHIAVRAIICVEF